MPPKIEPLVGGKGGARREDGGEPGGKMAAGWAAHLASCPPARVLAQRGPKSSGRGGSGMQVRLAYVRIWRVWVKDAKARPARAGGSPDPPGKRG